jgi:hypothetical protein
MGAFSKSIMKQLYTPRTVLSPIDRRIDNLRMRSMKYNRVEELYPCQFRVEDAYFEGEDVAQAPWS